MFVENFINYHHKLICNNIKKLIYNMFVEILLQINL